MIRNSKGARSIAVLALVGTGFLWGLAPDSASTRVSLESEEASVSSVTSAHSDPADGEIRKPLAASGKESSFSRSSFSYPDEADTPSPPQSDLANPYDALHQPGALAGLTPWEKHEQRSLYLSRVVVPERNADAQAEQSGSAASAADNPYLALTNGVGLGESAYLDRSSRFEAYLANIERAEALASGRD